MKQLKGFTLVELLIVIALIAILSVAVLATINPIEQTNKARDAQFKNDAAEVLNALERYYASNQQYPWNNTSEFTGVVPILGALTAGDPIALRSDDSRMGVVGVNSVGGTGVLIATSELKSAFTGKTPFTADLTLAANNVDAFYVYQNGIDSNYVCFVPKATANRTKTADLKCLEWNPVTSAAVLRDYDVAGANCNTVSTWAPDDLVPNIDVANLTCVPEGEVQ